MSEIIFGNSSCFIYPEGPLWNDETAATIGKLKIANSEEGAALLNLACEKLKEIGAKSVLSPMDGDTWHNYRTIIESDGSNPYALEPISGAHDYQSLVASGFEVLEYYASSRAIVPPAGSQRPNVDNVNIVQWDGKGADSLLDKLYNIAANSFADKLFFKALSKQEFLELYIPLLTKLDPRLILFAFDNQGQLIGFLFGLPDFLEANFLAGEKPTQAIIKTYASMRRGVGHLLAWQFHELAREMGYKHVIHALMHQENISLDRSQKHSGEIFRKYAIFGKKL